MNKSIKLNDNTYLDSSGVTHNRALLSTILDYQDFNERYVGKWYNGKSIFKKIIAFTPDNYSEYSYYHNISNIDEVLPMSCAIFHRINGQYVPMSMYYPTGGAYQYSNQWSLGWQVTKGYIQTWIGTSMFAQMDSSNYGVVAIIFYTKK